MRSERTEKGITHYFLDGIPGKCKVTDEPGGWVLSFPDLEPGIVAHVFICCDDMGSILSQLKALGCTMEDGKSD